MPYNYVADSIHIKKLCSRLSSSEVQFDRKRPFCVFEPPPALWRLRGNVRCSSVIGNRVVDFL